MRLETRRVSRSVATSLDGTCVPCFPPIVDGVTFCGQTAATVSDCSCEFITLPLKMDEVSSVDYRKWSPSFRRWVPTIYFTAVLIKAIEIVSLKTWVPTYSCYPRWIPVLRDFWITLKAHSKGTLFISA